MAAAILAMLHTSYGGLSVNDVSFLQNSGVLASVPGRSAEAAPFSFPRCCLIINQALLSNKCNSF
jgi:hypothetical protein